MKTTNPTIRIEPNTNQKLQLNQHLLPFSIFLNVSEDTFFD